MNRQTTLTDSNADAQDWVHIDATDQVLGRLSTQVAMILMGKTKPTYTPHQLTGDFVVVTNAQNIKVTGKKLDQRTHKTFSGHPSGLKAKTYRDVMAKHPERLIEESVRRMLPKTKLGTKMLSRLKVYAGPEHPHTAQNPKAVELQTA